MKHILLSLLFLFTFINSYISQENEGFIKYSINIETEDEENAAMMEMMFKDASMDVYYNGTFTRTDINMGMVMSMKVVANISNENIVLFTSGLVGKKAVKTTKKELNKSNSQENETSKITYIKGRKKILGYRCKKAISIDKDGNESIYWYTKKIKINVSDLTGNQFFSKNIDGIPLEITTISSGMKMTLTAKEFSKKLKNQEVVFDMNIPDDYEKMTLDEFQNIGESK